MNFKSSPSISSINVVQLCLTMNLIKWEILIYMYNAWAHRFNGFNICLLASSIPSWLAASQIPTEPSRPVLAEPYLQLIDVAVTRIVQIKQHRSKICLSEGCAVSDGPFDGGYKLPRLSSQSSDDSPSIRLNFQLQEDFQRLHQNCCSWKTHESAQWPLFTLVP